MAIDLYDASEPEKWEQEARKLFAAETAKGYQMTGVHLYRAADHSIRFARVRMHKPDATKKKGYEKFIRPFYRDDTRWMVGEPKQEGGKLLYSLPDVSAYPDALVVLTEGEQKADALTSIGASRFIGVTSGGATSAVATDFSPLSGKHVLVWPDYDVPGQKYADDVTDKLCPLGCVVERVDVAGLGLPDGGDVMDWLDLFRTTRGREPSADDVLALPRTNKPVQQIGGTDSDMENHLFSSCKDRAALLAQAEDAIGRTVAGDAGALFDCVDVLRDLRISYPADYARIRVRIRAECRSVRISDLEQQMRSDVNTSDEKSVADMLIEMADERCDLFHNPDRCAFALIESDGHRECWPVRSDGFREWLSFTFYQQHGRAPTDLAISTALATIEGKAKFDGEERCTYLRVASVEGSLWIDLCNDTWQAVEITATGWRVVDDPPPNFIRTASMRALPSPTVSGSLDSLWEIVNIPEGDRLLVVTWMLECFRPTTPYPVLELTGEQGSAKSTTQHYLRELVDPNRSNNRAAPKNVDDVYVAAQNAHLMSFENLSHLSATYQDALCVLATGAGYSTRRLFTNTDEIVLDLKKPIALNGISVIVTAQDLSDRALHIDLTAIATRATANEIQKAFEMHRNGIFGALLDVLARSLAELQVVSAEKLNLPRMADFAQLGEAVYRVHGEPPGAFLHDYAERRREGVHRTIEASPVGMAILAYLEANPAGFAGTIGRLHEVLADYRQDSEAWPKSAKGMGDAFRRLAPALRQIGVTAWASERRGMHGYMCSLKKTADPHISRANVATGDLVHQVHNVHANTADSASRDERDEHHELGPMQQQRGEHISQENCNGYCATEDETEDRV